MNEVSIGAFAVTAVLGYAVVFIGLILLMAVVILMGRIMKSRTAVSTAAPAAAPQPVSASAPAPAPSAPPAPGAAGELKLYHTDAKTAAMLMAIVADELQTPLNELRFKSIKEVKDDEI